MSETVISPAPGLRSAGRRSVRTSSSGSEVVVPIQTKRTSLRVLSYVTEGPNADVPGLLYAVTCSGVEAETPVASTVRPKISFCAGTVLTLAA